jgi:heme exporter protein A
MLQTQNITCRRGGRVVFRDVEFTLEPGTALVIGGANGCGKSSLLRILAGLIEPAAGSILWQGAAIDQDPFAHRARLHYVGHLDAAKPALTVCETLDYWRALEGTNEVNEAALDAFALRRLIDRPVRSLSAGQKRRLTLTRLVLRPALLWLLDEPTTSLDREGQDLLRDQILRHVANGGMVIAATHEELNLPQARKFNMTPGAR